MCIRSGRLTVGLRLMDIVFEKGSREKPRGHALLYFKSSSDPQEIWASYLVVLPITVDVSKYVPPFLMSQIGELGPNDLSTFAFPPAPEKVEGYQRIETLAAMRDDDVLFGGTINPLDVASAMMSLNEAVRSYAEICSERQVAQGVTDPEADQSPEGLGVNEVLYGLMSDGDKVGELTKLVGRLRYVLEGTEESLVKEAEADINVIAQHLPENHRIPRLIEVAKAGGGQGARLTDLYLQRCFHLIQEEYVKLGEVEKEIRVLEGSEPE